MADDINSVLEAVKSYIALERASGIRECYSAAAQDNAGTAAASGLESLRAEVSKCRKCSLAKTRTNLVFGTGSPGAKLMFVGEAPGEDEDLQGMPFVGKAGQLLTKIIEAMGMKRSDVYIANMLKCRPPNNRPPLPEEIAACRCNVERQIEIIKPRVICTLGKFASQALLETETPISALRGKFQDYRGIMVMPTFHPAYLLRNPNEKKTVWADMKKIMKELQ